MTLDAGVVGMDIIQTSRIEDGGARLGLHMFAARAMAALAADVPFGDGLLLDVVFHRVTAVAERAGGAHEIVGWIERRPPIRALGGEIGPPYFVGHIPLRRLGIIIIA